MSDLLRLVFVAAFTFALAPAAHADPVLTKAAQEVAELKFPVVSGRPTPRDPVTFVIFHTNDIHGHLKPQDAIPSLGIGPTGGIASLATMLKREKRPWLWIDSGDWAQGTPLGSMSKGAAVVPFFNRLGLTATTIGNHDFDWGEDNLDDLLEKARFIYLGSNVKPKVSRASYSEEIQRHDLSMISRLVEPIPGFKVGLFGLLAPDTPAMLLPGRMARHDVLGVVQTATYVSMGLREEGANLVIAVTHLGIEKTGARTFKLAYEGDLALAEGAPDVDMILGGHVHVDILNPYIHTADGRTVVVTQTAGMLRSVYRIAVTVDRKTKALISAKAELIALDPAVYPPDPEIASMLEDAENALGPELRKVVGRAAVDLRHQMLPLKNIPDVTPMGALVTEAFRQAAGADFGALSSFGIRSFFKAGEITYEDIFNALPFENALVRFHIKGSDLRSYLSRCESGPDFHCQWSGIRATYGPDGRGGRALLAAEVAGQPLDDERLYTGATDRYYVQGLKVQDQQTLPELDRDAMADYLQRNSPLTPAAPAVARD